ncbi:MAG TPA: hypothetical protein VFM58_00880 [Solirubrobacteraceae bacterium]|jgi:hypothetical protein|nr:hypothetical protein [Solirubrobacteraceae bacterium]
MSPDEPAVTPLNGALAELVERARAALARDDIPHGELGQALLTAGVALVAEQLEQGVPCAPFAPYVEVTPTEVALVTLVMLEAADIDMPQLAMWEALGMGAPQAPDGGA